MIKNDILDIAGNFYYFDRKEEKVTQARSSSAGVIARRRSDVMHDLAYALEKREILDKAIEAMANLLDGERND